MNTRTLSLLLAVALGCSARGGGGGGGFTPDAGPTDDVQGGGDVPVTGDDVPATGDDVPVVGEDVAPTPCTGDKGCGAGRFCADGTCRPRVCVPGTATCGSATSITLCDPRGASQSDMPCPGGAACTQGRCQSPRVCEPGASLCDGTSARRVCTPDGTSYMTVACAGGERCTNGGCVATQVCVPGTASCADEGNRRVCNSAGSGYTITACPTAANATSSCRDGNCVATCTPGFANCDGNAANGCEAPLNTALHCGACNNACAAGQTCTAGSCTGGSPSGNFRVNSLLTTGCTTVEHGSISGDDRGPLAAVTGFLVVSGDERTVTINTATQAVTTAPIRLDWITSNLRTGQLVVFAANTLPLPADSGGMASQIIVVDPATGQPVGSPVSLSQSIRVAPGAGLFAGWDRAVVWDGATLWNINLTSGAVQSLGPWMMPTHSPCELGGLWGVVETEGNETNLVYVSGASTVSRVRVGSRAVTTVATFSNLSDMCGISVLPSANRWFFHHEGGSQFRSTGDEVAGWCGATFSTTPTTCTAPEIDCGGTCVNPQTAAAHCGRCNNPCAAGQTCNAGVCSATAGGYTRSSPTLAWTDACALPGVVRQFSTAQDDNAVVVPMPFPSFMYWGRRVTAINISTNGFVSLDGATNSSTGGSLPAIDTPNAVVAPWWTDLRTPVNSLCYATTGTVGARTFFAQWSAVNYYSTSTGALSFQVRLNEMGNTIDLVYNSLSAVPSGYYVAVGIENWEGTQANAVCAGAVGSTRCTEVTAASRFRFTPN